MGFCRYFKKGYFGVCTASESNHVPGIAEMGRYCLKENFLCPIFELHASKDIDVKTGSNTTRDRDIQYGYAGKVNALRQ
jgi:hypothetical protein